MAILTSDSHITADSVPYDLRQSSSPATAGLQGIRDSAERDRIREALDRTHWNVSRAARLLGIERSNLHKRMRALGLSRAD
jgi:two-component system nitrogen regulation response regulator NtrX